MYVSEASTSPGSCSVPRRKGHNASKVYYQVFSQVLGGFLYYSNFSGEGLGQGYRCQPGLSSQWPVLTTTRCVMGEVFYPLPSCLMSSEAWV